MRDARTVAGFIGLHVVLAAPGAACLAALGFLRLRPLPLAAAAGPAFLLGAVITTVPLIALLVIGVPVGGPLSVAVAAGLTAVLVLVAMRMRGRRRSASQEAPEVESVSRYEVVIERALLGLVAAYLAFGALAFTNVPTMWDDANIWSLKGLTLYYHDDLVAGVFRNPQFSTVHIDYPILQPLLESSFFRAIGEVDLRLWHVEIWIVFSAVLWTLAWLLASLGRRWLWVIIIGVLATSSVAIGNVTLGDADLTMAGLIGCGALAFGIWLERGRTAHALLGALFIAGAGNVKNEGIAFGFAIVLALVLVVLAGARLRARWRQLAVALAVIVGCVLPWQLWVSTNAAATHGTVSPLDVIDDPDFLWDRRDFLWRGIQQVVEQLLSGPWGLMIPALIVTGLVFLMTRERREVASFYLLAWFLSWLAVGYTYWVTPIGDIGGFELRTGPRIVLGAVFVAAVGLAHLIQMATAQERTEAEGRSPDEAREPVSTARPTSGVPTRGAA